MGSTTEIFLLLNVVGTIASIATPILIWYLSAIMKKGFDEHVGMMELIYEEIRKPSRSDST